jgi:23S rRNA (pseudouridine1915-N3)-methyltransferase
LSKKLSRVKIQLWTFGKENEPYIRDGIHLFSNRLKHYCDFSIKVLHAGKNTSRLPPEELKKKEARVILSILEAQHILFTLDEKGKEITSIKLAGLLEKHQLLASRVLVFLIGGAYGTDESILIKSRGILSLSQLTFPHQLVRLIMTEQLYRAFTILNHEQYHHL